MRLKPIEGQVVLDPFCGVEIKSLSIMRLKHLLDEGVPSCFVCRNQKPLNYEIETGRVDESTGAGAISRNQKPLNYEIET